MNKSHNIAHLRAVKARYEAELMKKRNVVAVGIGVPIRDGKPVGPPGIVVSVTHKVAADQLQDHDVIPQILDDVPVWIEAVEQPRSIEVDTTIFPADNEISRGDEDAEPDVGERPQDLPQCDR